MAKYVTQVSDYKKSKVYRAWFIGLFGALGFHYFSVLRIKAGIIRLLIGAIWLTLAIFLSFDSDTRAELGVFPTIFMIILLLIPAVVDLIRIALGKFKDNLGNNVREK